MAGFHKPSAEQIVSLKDEKIVLNTTLLEQILTAENLRDKPVCVISITGVFRQGKSFLLNYFVRYLLLRYKLKRLNGNNWLNSADGPISGFPWKIGSQRHTEGILMWSEIFLAKLPSGEEVAIILLDTQGSFDNHSSISSCAALFALSTLISSVQIYNLKETIKQYDLAHLECFSGYGQLAGDFNKSPFQDLIFLIRDWPWPHEKEYGANGGQVLLNEIFHNSTEQPSELVSQVKNIKELFQNISCVLLPHPGFKVASADSFQEDLEEIDPAFNKQVEAFVSSILAPEKLVPKTATSDAQHAVAVKNAKAIYEESMESVKSGTTPALEIFELYLKNHQSRNKALQYFSNKKIMGNTDIKKKFQSLLEKKLGEKFVEYENINKIKYQKEQDVKKEAQFRIQQQLENERRFREKQRLHEEQLKREQELRRSEQIRMEKERQREEELRKEQQRKFEQYRQEQEFKREQERRKEEERIKEHQRQHEREMEKLKQEERERREYELERRRESQMHQSHFCEPWLYSGFQNAQMYQPHFYNPYLSNGFQSSFFNSMSNYEQLTSVLNSMSLEQSVQPRRRGRPPGSKNKPK